MYTIKNIGLIINYNKNQPIELGKELISWFNERDINVYAPKEEAKFLNLFKSLSQEEICSKIDCLLVLGGDGTFLRGARYVVGTDIPILGVNLGRLGFLTEIEVSEVYIYLEKLLTGDFSIEERSMLFAKVKRDNASIGNFFALNDFVIYKGSFSRLITLDVSLGDEYISSYSADGIIISTPTGSTAYSLSAGGPIVYPGLNVSILTPVCPHSLSARPLVIPPDKVIKVSINAVNASAKLTVDGQCGFQLKNGDVVIIENAQYVTKLIRIKENSFFNILREKLKIDGGNRYE